MSAAGSLSSRGSYHTGSVSSRLVVQPRERLAAIGCRRSPASSSRSRRRRCPRSCRGLCWDATGNWLRRLAAHVVVISPTHAAVISSPLCGSRSWRLSGTTTTSNILRCMVLSRRKSKRSCTRTVTPRGSCAGAVAVSERCAGRSSGRRALGGIWWPSSRRIPNAACGER